VNKLGTGNLILSAANTCAGTTTISQGTLTLSSTGSINNSPLIDVHGVDSYPPISNFASVHTSPQRSQRSIRRRLNSRRCRLLSGKGRGGVTAGDGGWVRVGA
jgi:autotransporter-associated beta strand protein